jgi:exosortase/archaeosortase family protein
VSTAWRAGTLPARPIGLDLKFARASAFACAGVLAALNAQADHILVALKYQPLVTAVSGLAGISAVMWVAMYAVLRLGFEAGRRAITRTDAIMLATVVILSFLPVSYAAQAGLLLCALYLLATSTSEDDLRRIALLLLALTGPLLWGRIFLQELATPLLSLDAHLVGFTIGTKVDGNTVQFAGSAKQFLIGTGCSSVHNMSLAIVLWTTAAVVFRIRIDARYIACGFAMAGLMFAMNIARLAAIGLYPGSFEFLHDGAGADLFGWAGLIGAGLIAALGVLGAVRRQQ